MSENHISSCVPIIESNIPIPKRVLAEAKKSKGCTRLPELQKYIDTIIKASNHCDHNNDSNRERFARDKKMGRYSLPKAISNKLKFDKIRVDMTPSRRKTVNSPRTPTPEGCRNDDSPNSFVSGFEDPRNWKFNKVQNSNFSLKVERFLKELYPNPYHLESLTEFHGLRSVPSAASREEMIPENLIVQENPEPEVKPESKDSITAVVEINQNGRETVAENPEPDTCSEKCTPPERNESAEALRRITPPEMNQEQKARSSRSKIRPLSNGVSSSSETPSSPTDSLQRKRTSTKMNRKWNSKERLESAKSKSSTLAFGDDRTDHDIGKLMLLSRSDSDASMPRRSKDSKLKKWETEEAVKKSSSRLYKQAEMNDLRKIQEVMNRANKSFILSEKNQKAVVTPPEKPVTNDNFIDGLKGMDRSLKHDMRRAIHEEREKHNTIKHDHDAIDINTKINPESKPIGFDSGFSKPSSRDSGVSKSTVFDSRFSKPNSFDTGMQKPTVLDPGFTKSNSFDTGMQKPTVFDPGFTKSNSFDSGFPKSCSLDSGISKPTAFDCGISKPSSGHSHTQRDNAKPTVFDSEISKQTAFDSGISKPTAFDCGISKPNAFDCGISKPTVHDSGTSKPTAFDSGFTKPSSGHSHTQRDNASVKSEPERPKGTDFQANARKISKTVLDLKQSLSNIEQRIKEKKVKSEDTSQKIGEVLEFMYDCLMKFSNSEELTHEGESSASLVRRIFSTNQIVQPSTSKLSDDTEALFRATSPQNSQNVGAITETRRRNRVRCRRSELAMQTENKQEESSPSTTAGAEVLLMNSEGNSENQIPTVETQNELGGCAELTSEDRVSGETVRHTKPVSPIPGKLNRSKADPKSIREVLETEEKLFARDFNQKDKFDKNRAKEFITCKIGDDCRISESFSGFKCPNSNFVICVNSLPRNLKTFTAVTPVIAIPQCPQVPIIGVREHREIKPMACKSEFSLKEYYAATEINYRVLTCTYRLKQGSVFQMNKLNVEYIAVPVCEKVISSTPELKKESSLKNSECFINFSMKTVNRPVKVTKVNRGCLTVSQLPSMKSSNESGINFESEDERRVDALVDAIEDAEGKILLLQQINQACRKENESTSRNCRASQTVESESLDSDPKNRGDRKKVQDLLRRTYNLQLKLQECMNKISGLHPNIPHCTSRPQTSNTDFTVCKCDKTTSSETSMTESNGKRGNSYPLVHWYPIPRRQPYMGEVIVPKVDHSTSYSPPSEKRNKKTREEPGELPRVETEKGTRNEEDDRSSVCSFKSSNDYSQESDTSLIKKELKVPESMSRKEFYRKIHAEIELIRRFFKTESLQKDLGETRQKDSSENRQNDHSTAPSVNKDSNPQEEGNQNPVVQYDPKAPSKILKTVFKGRDSSTELTIGLKDIPMTQVKNISVEKTKLTPNHTKISICISKEKCKDVRVTNVGIGSEVLQNKIPTYCYKHLARSLKGSPSEEEEEASKSSQSIQEESDDNEDDYKSVASTIDESEADHSLQKTTTKEHKSAKAPLQKKTPKHRFDFYQKMNINPDEKGVKPKAVAGSVCRYKELEPLKQAMTEMQIRMRSIKRDALYNSNDYYERALKLAKMSAGYCQSCGNRAVIPNDTFGYYKSLVPRRCANRALRHYKSSVSSNPSFYSFHSSNADVGEHICDLDIKHNSYLLNRTTHSNRTILRGSLQDMPVLFERM